MQSLLMEERKLALAAVGGEQAEFEQVRQRLIQFEQERIFKNEDLARLVRRNARNSLHAEYEAKLFNKRYESTVTDKQIIRPTRDPVALAPAVEQRKVCKMRTNQLKKMQARNFIVTIFANTLFVPKQLVCGLITLAQH